MATTQKVIGKLKKAGKKIRKIERGVGMIQDGFSVSGWKNGLVGVLVNSTDAGEIAEFKIILENAGFKVWRPEGAAADGFFVK